MRSQGDIEKCERALVMERVRRVFPGKKADEPDCSGHFPEFGRMGFEEDMCPCVEVVGSGLREMAKWKWEKSRIKETVTGNIVGVDVTGVQHLIHDSVSI